MLYYYFKTKHQVGHGTQVKRTHSSLLYVFWDNTCAEVTVRECVVSGVWDEGVGGGWRRAEQSTHSETFMFFHYNRIFSLSPGTTMNFCFLVKLEMHACCILYLSRSVYVLLYDASNIFTRYCTVVFSSLVSPNEVSLNINVNNHVASKKDVCVFSRCNIY